MLFFLAGLLIFYVGIQDIGQGKIFYVAIAAIVLAATGLLTHLGFSFAESIKSSFLFRLGALVAVFALIVLTAQALGNNRAVTLISGKYRETLSIHFNWKDVKNEPAPQELDTELIVLIQNKGNYYVIKKQDLQSNQVNFSPEIYVIPEGNIKFAVIRKEVR
jgi:hypothetical protein